MQNPKILCGSSLLVLSTTRTWLLTMSEHTYIQLSWYKVEFLVRSTFVFVYCTERTLTLSRCYHVVITIAFGNLLLIYLHPAYAPHYDQQRKGRAHLYFFGLHEHYVDHPFKKVIQPNLLENKKIYALIRKIKEDKFMNVPCV